MRAAGRHPGFATRLRESAVTRLAAWARRRQGEDRLPVRLAARRIYILPTRAGLGFALLVFGMLLAGLNYANSLALFLTFLLAAVGLVAMHQCQRNLLGLEVAAVATEPAFAGDAARVRLVLRNSDALPRFGLEAKAHGAEARGTDLAPGASATLELAVPCIRRGRLTLERIGLSSSHPFGLFRAWTWLHVPGEILVYPAPRGTRRLPLPRALASSGWTAAQGEGLDEWTGLRPFRDGDSPRQVAWKNYARGSPLLVKEYQAAAQARRVLEFGALEDLDTEARLEQLARWVVAAEAAGECYEVALPAVRLESRRGPAHRHRCLAALALYGLPA